MVLFEERIRAPWWGWVLVWAWPLMLGVAYGYATTTAVGLAITIGVGTLGSVALSRSSPLITVDATGCRAGRAFLEAQFLGDVRALDRADARRLRGTQADARAYLLLRGWVPTAVRLSVDDPRDPTPYWYLSTRRPNALVMALTQARDNAHAPVEGFGSDPFGRA